MPEGGKDAAVLATLSTTVTFQIESTTGVPGVALLEAYDVDAP